MFDLGASAAVASAVVAMIAAGASWRSAVLQSRANAEGARARLWVKQIAIPTGFLGMTVVGSRSHAKTRRQQAT